MARRGAQPHALVPAHCQCVVCRMELHRLREQQQTRRAALIARLRHQRVLALLWSQLGAEVILDEKNEATP